MTLKVNNAWTLILNVPTVKEMSEYKYLLATILAKKLLVSGNVRLGHKIVLVSGQWYG